MTEAEVKLPKAKVVPFTFTKHGHALVDEYAWLQKKVDPEVIAYLEAENDYAKTVLRPTCPLQEQIYQEMVGRIQEDDISVPEIRREYLYYWRIRKGQQYRVFCRKHTSPEAGEEVLLDENALAEGKTYCRVQVFEPSPDNRLLAYSVDTTGSLVFDLFVKDMLSGEVMLGPVAQTAWTAAWAADSRTLFYTVFDASHRTYQLFRVMVAPGTSSGDAGGIKKTGGMDSGIPSKDAGGIQPGLIPAVPSQQVGTMVYHEPDDAFNLSIRRTRSGAYLLLAIASATTSEVRYLPAGESDGEWQVIEPRRHWVEYYAEHHGDRFLIRTNDDHSENFKLMAAPASSPGRENWREVLPHRAETLVEGVDAFRDHLIVYERRGGLQRLRISAPDGIANLHEVVFPDPAYEVGQQPNPEFESSQLRLMYSSLVTPWSTVDYDMERRTWNVRKVQQIPSGYDPSKYTSERLFATAPDGAQVPVSIVYPKGLKKDGQNPLLLEGYGSYGYSYDPGFDTRRLSLLERGLAFAIAHVRGGSELGRSWYENGRLMHKKNTFTDFIACAEALIAQGYTSPERLAIHGASAGGLLVSAVTNLRPELFKAVIARVPFTNVITAMLDPELPLTVIEWEQWGNPEDPQAFDYMLSYSPYENVTKQAYPHILVKAGLNDLQVPYWDPAKWVARLRALKTDGNRLLLVTNMGAGHGGASGRYDHLREDAEMYAFVIGQLVDRT